MKAVLLAGGLGSRLSEETQSRPKPMVEIGGRPILWHIMKIYSHYGITDFVVCLGYKGYMIKEYFFNYLYHNADLKVDLGANHVEVINPASENWRVELIDTGEHSMTGGRLQRVLPYLGDDDFCLTYGDGVADIDIGALIKFHNAHSGMCTVSAVQPPGRFGIIELQGEEGLVDRFAEKSKEDVGWINGGFFVMSPKIARYLDGDSCILEQAPLEQLSADKQMYAYTHRGFWHPMDTLRDKQYLEALISSGEAPWVVWEHR